MEFKERLPWILLIFVVLAGNVSSRRSDEPPLVDRIVTMGNGTALQSEVNASPELDGNEKRAFAAALSYDMDVQPYGMSVRDVIRYARQQISATEEAKARAADARARTRAGRAFMARRLRSDIVIRPLAIVVDRGSFLGSDEPGEDVDELYFRVENHGEKAVDDFDATTTVRDERGRLIYYGSVGRPAAPIEPGAHAVLLVSHTPDVDGARAARDARIVALSTCSDVERIEYVDGSSALIPFDGGTRGLQI